MPFRAELGDYEFEVAPGWRVEADRVVRESDNVAVSAAYTITLTCRVRRDADETSAAKLGAFLAECLHSRTCPPLYVYDLEALDDQGDPTPVPEIGQIDEEAEDEDETNLGWEDPRLVGFQLPDETGQFMAGATFVLTIQARRSFPDSDGVCEMDQVFEEDEDSSGNEVQRLTTRGRTAKASGATAETPAVAARLRLPAPVGWVRTVQSLRYPLYPERHVFEAVSEVRTNDGATGSSGATSARVGERVFYDPVKGVLRKVNTAETTGGEDPQGWVLDQAPGREVVSAEITTDAGTQRRTQGEWRRIESLTSQDRTTRVERLFTLRGGGREVGAVLMSPPVRPKIQRGPWEPYALTEQVEVRALAPEALDHFRLPNPLGVPWVAKSEDHALPRVEEDALVPGQRLWVWAVTREYVWDSEDHPLDHEALKGAVFAPASEVLA